MAGQTPWWQGSDSRSPCSFILDFEPFWPSLSGMFHSNTCKYMHSARLALFNGQSLPYLGFWKAQLEPRAYVCIKESRGHIYASCPCSKPLKTIRLWTFLQNGSRLSDERWKHQADPSALLLSYLIKSVCSETANRNLSTGWGLPMKMRVVPPRWLFPSQFPITPLKTCTQLRPTTGQQ